MLQRLALVSSLAFGAAVLIACTASETPVHAPGTAPDAATPALTPAAPVHAPDVPYEPSPLEVVSAMLELGQVRASDVVYDLGCGDGRIVIEAVKRHGARGVCIDIDPARIREAQANAESAGAAGSIRFITADLFESDLSDATVVMLFLWPEVNLRLRPKLQRELRPGTRVVSHWHDMGTWVPERTVEVDPAGGRARPLYLWTIGKAPP
jgi:SAM-dependent methyltransferase